MVCWLARAIYDKFVHSHVLFYLFDSEGGEDEAEDTERIVSSAPMGDGAPARKSAALITDCF